MFPFDWRGVWAVLCLFPLGAVADDTDVLREKVQVLEEEVRQLKAQNADIQAIRIELNRIRAGQQQDWMDEERAEEIKAIVHEVLADAETRKSLRGENVTAGFDKHFFLASEDDRFRLEISGQLQTRYLFNTRDEREGAADDIENGFSMRRAEIAFAGHVGDPRIQYKVKGGFSRSDGDFHLDDAYMKYKLDDHHYVQWGQFKPRFLREYLVSSSYQQAVERSNVSYFFRAGRSQGVQVGGQYDDWNWSLVTHDGRESVNDDFDGDETDFAVAGRAEFLVAGEWGQFKEFAAWSDEPVGLMVGAGFDYEIAEGGQSSDLLFKDFWQWTADISFKATPFNAFAAVVGRTVDGDAVLGSMTQLGLVVQGGVFIIPDKMDLFARWEYLNHDDFEEVGGNPAAIDSGLEDKTHVFTVGGNYYFRGHATKLSVDLLVAPDGIRQGESSTGTLDSSNNADQVAIRAQLQVMF